MPRLLGVALALSLSVCAFAQTPYMVADLKSGTPDVLRASEPSNFQMVGGTLYFSARHFETGRELWKWSGGQASLVKNFSGGSGDSIVDGVFDLGNGTLLTRLLVRNQVELWRTDGTPEGTAEVKVISPVNRPVPARVQAVFQNKLYFPGDDGVNGAELWVSDGTAGGTQMLLNLNGTSASSNISALTVYGDRLLIFAGNNMWSSDGTAAGTTQVATPGNVTKTVQAGSLLFLIANNSDTGRELWKTDGTAAGTQLLADVAPGTTNGITAFSATAVLGDTLYFAAAADGAGADLWKSDGTSAGTQLVTALANDSFREHLVAADGLLYILISDVLWRSDGTAAGTLVLDAAGVRSMQAAFGQAYYFKSTELRRSDGTTTSSVASFTGLMLQPVLTFTGGKLYFAAAMTDGIEPWVSEDGTAATTHQLANVNPDVAASSSPVSLAAAGDLLFFRASDGIQPPQLWRSNGTGGGTIGLATESATPFDQFSPWNGAMYFKRASELWRSDGTAAGTASLSLAGADAMTVSSLFPTTTSYLFMTAATASTATAFWRTDGTPAGTVSLPVGSAGSVAELAGHVYATSSNGMWVTQGTAESTKRIQVYNGQTALTPALGSIFYVANDQLWRTDGTAGGETLVKYVNPAGSSRIRSLTPAGRYVFFTADDGVHGEELWRTDGTPAGTILLADIMEGTSTSDVQRLTAAGDLLYFTARDVAHGYELWRTDGTPEGTAMVVDLLPGPDSSSVVSLRFAGGTLWFAANDGTSGDELWMLSSGGVPLLVADLVPGAGGSSPRELVQAGQLLFFAATSETLGRELWALQLSGAVFSAADARVIEGTGGTRTVRFTVTRKGSTNGAASVVFATRDVTATSGVDYVASSGTLSFSAGETAKNVDVTVQSDAEVELNESFLLVLSSPSGAVVERSSGAGVIEDDDHRVDVSVIVVQSAGNSNSRYFRIANAGPSTATDLTLRFSESPQKMELQVGPCGSTKMNPATCVLDPLPPGQSVLVRIERMYPEGSYDEALPAGRTVTASLTTAEPDSYPADNTVAAMMDGEGYLLLPSYLVSGTQAAATFRLQFPATTPLKITLESSSANVVVSPSFVNLAVGQSEATFTLTAGALQERVRLDAKTNGGWPYAAVTVAVAAPGTLPKLDPAIVAAGSRIVYGSDGKLPVEIAARRHDGTRPTGIVSLLDNASGAVLAQQSLDANASTIFTRSGLAPGRHSYRIRYSGDANFNPLEGTVAAHIDVSGWPTETSISVPAFICAGTRLQLPVVVKTSATTQAPTGTANVIIHATQYSIALSPTGVPGESRGVFEHTFTASDSYIAASYNEPASTFESSSDGEGFLTQPCIPMNVVATGTPTSVTVTWTAVAGAHHYEVIRSSNRASWGSMGTTAATSYVDTWALLPDRAYLYTVHAVDASGNTVGYAPPDVAMTMSFTDDPIVAGVTTIRAVHIDQLHTASNALQRLIDSSLLGPVKVPAGSVVTASGIAALRAGIEGRRLALGCLPLTYTTPSLTSGTPILAAHIQELRNAVR